MPRIAHYPRIERFNPRPTPASPAHSPVLLPTCAVPSPYQGRCTLGFHAKIRGCSGAGRRMVGRSWGDGGEAFVATWRAASHLKITAAFMRATARLMGILVGEVL